MKLLIRVLPVASGGIGLTSALIFAGYRAAAMITILCTWVALYFVIRSYQRTHCTGKPQPDQLMKAGRANVKLGLIYVICPIFGLVTQWGKLLPIHYVMAVIVFSFGASLVHRGRKLKKQATQEAGNSFTAEP